MGTRLEAALLPPGLLFSWHVNGRPDSPSILCLTVISTSKVGRSQCQGYHPARTLGTLLPLTHQRSPNRKDCVRVFSGGLMGIKCVYLFSWQNDMLHVCAEHFWAVSCNVNLSFFFFLYIFEIINHSLVTSSSHQSEILYAVVLFHKSGRLYSSSCVCNLNKETCRIVRPRPSQAQHVRFK